MRLLLQDKISGRFRAFPKVAQELYYIGGNETGNETPRGREKGVIRAKLTAAK